MCRVIRVKELNKDVARRALRHASSTCPADSMCLSLTPASPASRPDDDSQLVDDEMTSWRHVGRASRSSASGRCTSSRLMDHTNESSTQRTWPPSNDKHPTRRSVQTDLVLSSVMASPRLMLAEGECHVLRLGDMHMSADCCQPQSDTKVLSKHNDILGDYRPATNSSVICCRCQQDVGLPVADTSNSGEMSRRTTMLSDSTTSRNSTRWLDTAAQSTVDSAGNERAMKTTTSTHNSYRPQSQTQTQSWAEYGSKHVHDKAEMTTLSKQLTPPSVSSVSKKTGCLSVPDNSKLVAELINRISELAMRQDKLECVTPTPACQRSVAEKSSQTGSDLPTRSNEHQPPQQNDYDTAGYIGRREDGLLKQTRKQHGGTDEHSQTSEPHVSNETRNTVSSVYARSTNTKASQSTKLTSSERQHHDDVVAERTTAASAVTDNVIHIVRGSNALEELTAEELVRQHCEPWLEQVPSPAAAPDVSAALNVSVDHQAQGERVASLLRDDGGRGRSDQEPGSNDDSPRTDIASCTPTPCVTADQHAKLRMQYVLAT